MVVKAATKKKLMDLGCPEIMAHKWADGRKWNIIVLMNFDDIMSIFSDSPYLPWAKYSKLLPKGVVREKYIYDIVRKMRENELDKVIGMDPLRLPFPRSRTGTMAEYIKMIENFGRIPAGSPYSYLREDSQNFMNWINENPFEVK